MGRTFLISFAYLSRATPEPSRAHRSRTMPRSLGSIATHDASMLDRLALRSPFHPRSHDASMLDHHASHLASMPRLHLASMPRDRADIVPRSHSIG